MQARRREQQGWARPMNTLSPFLSICEVWLRTRGSSVIQVYFQEFPRLRYTVAPNPTYTQSEQPVTDAAAIRRSSCYELIDPNMHKCCRRQTGYFCPVTSDWLALSSSSSCYAPDLSHSYSSLCKSLALFFLIRFSYNYSYFLPLL